MVFDFFLVLVQFQDERGNEIEWIYPKDSLNLDEYSQYILNIFILIFIEKEMC